MRTICYQPGPLQMPDLADIDIKANGVLSTKVEDADAPNGVVNGAVDGHANGANDSAPIDEKVDVSEDDEAINGSVVATPPAVPILVAAA